MTEHQQRIEDFISQLQTGNDTWLLTDGEALLMTPANNNEEQDVLQVWSSEELALSQCSGQWTHFKAISFDKEELLDLLAQLTEDDVDIGIDLTAEQVAIELPALELETRLK